MGGSSTIYVEMFALVSIGVGKDCIPLDWRWEARIILHIPLANYY